MSLLLGEERLNQLLGSLHDEVGWRGEPMARLHAAIARIRLGCGWIRPSDHRICNKGALRPWLVALVPSGLDFRGVEMVVAFSCEVEVGDTLATH